MRFFLYLLLLTIGETAFSQALLPEQQGGNKNKILNLRENPIPPYDFIKFNPEYQAAAPAKRICTTYEVEEKRMRGESNNSFEKWMRRTLEEDPLIAKSTEIFTIPIVVHVIYSNMSENISNEQILSQIEVLNADYRHLNKDTSLTQSRFRTAASDMHVAFKFATRDPKGKPTDGIDRISMAGSPFSEKYINEVIKPNTIWNTSEYLNLWVCFIDNNVLGFSQFPESSGLVGIPSDIGTVFTDGIVITYTAFGTLGTVNPPFDKGRTATHEIGHWLGLRHIWGDGTGDCSADDYCEDTPLTKVPNFGCKVGIKGCKDTAMVENFMDYTDDKCMNIFSNDQKKRIWSVLENSPRRKELGISAAAKPLAIPPTPAFISDISVGSQSLNVGFKDISKGSNRSRKWIFVGGVPATSTEAEPIVFYSKPGKYAVSLSLSNEYGTETQKIDNYITIYGKGETLPMSFDFEANAAHSAHIQPAAWGNTWKIATTLGGYGKSSGAIWINNYVNNRPGARSYFMLPCLDFSTGAQTQLSFDIAYQFFNEKYADTLGIYLSTDEGKTFHAIYYKSGKKLSENASNKNLYNPAPEDWRTEMIDLSRYDENTHVQIAFVCMNGYGNNLYLDNIKVSSTPLPLPNVDFEADRQEICVGDAVGFNDKTGNKPVKWLWSFPGATHTSDTSRNPVISYQKAGLYEVSLTAINSSGEAVLSKKNYIRVKPEPPLTLSAIPQAVCPRTALTIRATGGSYFLWVYGDRESNESVIVDTLLFSKSYELKVLGDSGCSAIQRFTIKVKDEKEIEVKPPVSKVCDGQMTNIVASGGKEYTWKNPTGNIVSNTNTLATLATSNIKYSLSIKTESGCVFNRIVPVNVERRPIVTIQPSANAICAGSLVQLKASGAISYIWNQRFGGKMLQISPSETALYFVVGTNEAGCKDSTDIEIKVNPRPSLTCTPATAIICEGENTTLRGEGAQSYVWKSQDKSENSNGPAFTIGPIISQDYYLIGTSDKGCKDTLSIPIQVQKLQKIHIQAKEYAVCKHESISFSVGNGKNIVWTNLTTQAVSATERFTLRPEKTTSLSVSGIDGNGCKMIPDTIEVHALQTLKPLARFGYVQPPNLCAGQTVQFVDSSIYARKYFWEFEGGVPLFSAEENPKVVYKKGGSYRVTLVVEGCNANDTLRKEKFIHVDDVPRMQVSSDKPYLCFGESATLTTSATGAESFVWSPAFGLNTSEGNIVSATPTDSTTYTVTATMPNGCTLSKSISIPVKKSGMTLNILPENPAVCQGESLLLTAVNGQKHYWSSIENDFSKAGTSISITPRKTGKYLLVASDSLNCSMKKEIQVTVFRQPRLSLDPPDALLCKGQQKMIEATGAGTYSWSPAISLSAVIGKRVTAFPSTTQTYTVLGTDENGCKDSLSIRIGVSDTPPVQLKSELMTLCKGMATQITATGGAEYEWFPASDLDANTGEKVVASPKSDVTYVVHATAEDGCTSTASIMLHVNEMIPIPISPEAPVICLGESVSLTATTDYNSRWGEGIPIKDISAKKVTVKPKETTRYQVNVWDENGCPRIGEVTVVVRVPPEVSIVAAQTAVCEGGTLTLQAKGRVEYEWLPAQGLTPMSEGKAMVNPQKNAVYSVVGKDTHGCKDTASFAVNTRLMQPVIDIFPPNIDLAKEAGLVRFTDKTLDATQWLWDFGDGGSSDQQQTNHVYTHSGIYPIRLTVSNGLCSKILSKQIEVKNSTDVRLIERVGALSVKAQANGMVHVYFRADKEMVFILSILDAKKEEVLSGKIRTNAGKYEQDIDLSSFGKGKYILQIQDEKTILAHPFEWQ